MPNADDIRWFKTQFQDRIAAAIAGTPFSVDFLVAVACQETGEVWPILRKKNLSLARILELCVGDTIDGSGSRTAFPTSKADLVAAPNGQAMFDVARAALVDMASFVPSYRNVAQRPTKFCHGFGVFQRDLQFYKVDRAYFLEKRYADFDQSLGMALDELKRGAAKLGFAAKTSLTDFEAASVAIAYNTGRFRPSRGLKQGFFDGQRFYGERIFDYVRLSKTVSVDGAPAPIPAPNPGTSPVPPPSPVTATGRTFRVNVPGGFLNLRKTPEVPSDPKANFQALLPDKQIVRAVSATKTNNFLEVETSVDGALLHGFASAKFLKAAPDVVDVPVVSPVTPDAPAAPGPVVAVFAPRRPGTVTKRANPANALSLNEPNQPAGRRGTTPEELCDELAAIVDWLKVDAAAHLRYKPRTGATFCNVYAHDFCHLAGVYIPRVWWSGAAIARLPRGEVVDPVLGRTIDEQRANDLFRWFRDFGLQFGWRRTGSLDTLQQEANQGAIGVIVARRREDGRSGHISIVVPETEASRARRDASGAVVAPLQSQAGATNFRRGTGKAGWWLGAQFAEFAFWLHG